MNKPLLTALSFSGGKQSSALLWMVILEYIKKPDNFVVLNADPGMENSFTYKYIDFMFDRAKEAGIECIKVDGPNLYEDIINLKTTSKTRLDNPKYYVDKLDGTLGTLRQKCTQAYKIFPMDREIRRILAERFSIPINRARIGNNIVERWIGFTYSELERIKPSQRKYYYLRYPLIEMKMKNDDIIKFYIKNKLPIPPRSVCNACFANGLDTFKEMYLNRPNDWKQAVNVDKAIRDWSQIKVTYPVYVSNTLIPLEVLAENDFEVSKFKKDLESDYSCDSGYCFI